VRNLLQYLVATEQALANFKKILPFKELQRSVIFFSKANGTLKMQNEELSRRYLEAKSRVASIEGNSNGSETTCKVEESQTSQQVTPHFLNEQIQAQAVAAQALYESQGFPSGAARAAAQAMNGSTPGTEASSTASTANVPQMQPGATMQAMAAFQQAAAAAMQAAMGMNPATNPQQIYTDAMNAFVQQNGHVQFPFMSYPAAIPMPMMWQHQNKTSSEVAQNIHQEQKAL
jgi:hypothetical protein